MQHDLIEESVLLFVFEATRGHLSSHELLHATYTQLIACLGQVLVITSDILCSCTTCIAAATFEHESVAVAVFALQVLYVAKALELTARHYAQFGAQSLALLHTKFGFCWVLNMK